MNSEPRFRGFNRHPELEGTHALLSPSKYHWVNDTPEKLEQRLKNAEASARGDSLHALAAHAISEGVYLAEEGDQVSLAMYVNHTIDFGMEPEVGLFYSFNCFGRADAIGFEEEIMFLRIHDFKSGVSKTSEKQLYSYASLFCLEYEFKPYEIRGELRIYQHDGYRPYEIDPDTLAHFYDATRMHSKHADEYRARRRHRWTSR